VDQVRTDAHPDGLTQEAEQTQSASDWWPLDCLRSLGRAAAIASGAAVDAAKRHSDHRDFRILTIEQDGAYRAHITHWRDEPLSLHGKLARDIGNARFASHEEAAQHARFLIVSGALNHLGPGA
jgi:hypothetical protein